MRPRIVTLALLAIAIAGAATAANQPKGHIINVDGEKCTFTQTTVSEAYLHSIPANTGNLVFDNENCMNATDVALLVNQSMIAGFITRGYSHADAAFQTKIGQFKSSSSLQVRGICIQSAKYPIVGVVAEFQIKGDHIVGVKHAMSVQGCKD